MGPNPRRKVLSPQMSPYCSSWALASAAPSSRRVADEVRSRMPRALGLTAAAVLFSTCNPTLGYDIWLPRFAFILTADPASNLFDHAGLRALTQAELDLTAAATPRVYECRDGRQTRIASIYDSHTLSMGARFYQGLQVFF